MVGPEEVFAPTHGPPPSLPPVPIASESRSIEQERESERGSERPKSGEIRPTDTHSYNKMNAAEAAAAAAQSNGDL